MNLAVGSSAVILTIVLRRALDKNRIEQISNVHSSTKIMDRLLPGLVRNFRPSFAVFAYGLYYLFRAVTRGLIVSSQGIKLSDRHHRRHRHKSWVLRNLTRGRGRQQEAVRYIYQDAAEFACQQIEGNPSLGVQIAPDNSNHSGRHPEASSEAPEESQPFPGCSTSKSNAKSIVAPNKLLLGDKGVTICSSNSVPESSSSNGINTNEEISYNNNNVDQNDNSNNQNGNIIRTSPSCIATNFNLPSTSFCSNNDASFRSEDVPPSAQQDTATLCSLPAFSPCCSANIENGGFQAVATTCNLPSYNSTNMVNNDFQGVISQCNLPTFGSCCTANVVGNDFQGSLSVTPCNLPDFSSCCPANDFQSAISVCNLPAFSSSCYSANMANNDFLMHQGFMTNSNTKQEPSRTSIANTCNVLARKTSSTYRLTTKFSRLSTTHFVQTDSCNKVLENNNQHVKEELKVKESNFQEAPKFKPKKNKLWKKEIQHLKEEKRNKKRRNKEEKRMNTTRQKTNKKPNSRTQKPGSENLKNGRKRKFVKNAKKKKDDNITTTEKLLNLSIIRMTRSGKVYGYKSKKIRR